MDSFDIKNCVRFEDKTYFWDTRVKSVVELEMRSIAIGNCPKCVVEALLTAATVKNARS
jgi:hypothetical protein